MYSYTYRKFIEASRKKRRNAFKEASATTSLICTPYVIVHCAANTAYSEGAHEGRIEVADVGNGFGPNRQDRLCVLSERHDWIHEAAVREGYNRRRLRRNIGVSVDSIAHDSIGTEEMLWRVCVFLEVLS